MSSAKKSSYAPPKDILEFLEQPIPRSVGPYMRDRFLAQYNYSGAVAFKYIIMFLYILSLTVLAFSFWLVASLVGGNDHYSSFPGPTESEFKGVIFIVAMIVSFLWFIDKIHTVKEERKYLIDMLANGVLASGRIVAVEQMQHGRYGTAHVAIFEYLGPEGKTTVGRFQTLGSAVGIPLHHYCDRDYQILLLYMPSAPAAVIPLMSCVRDWELEQTISFMYDA